jgi:hypothetical protein
VDVAKEKRSTYWAKSRPVGESLLQLQWLLIWSYRAGQQYRDSVV